MELYKRGKKDVESLAKEAWIIIEAQGKRLLKDGKPMPDKEDNIKEFKSMAKKFLDKRLPIIKAVQII